METLRKQLKQLNDEAEQHSLRVASLCKEFAPIENVDETIAETVGLLHDIGKIFIPSRILKKNVRLTDLERQMIDLHSYYGYKMLKEAGMEKRIYIPVLYHHGFGKQKLENIEEVITEEEVRLIRLVHTLDIFDALTCKRVYREAYTIKKTLNLLYSDELCDEALYEAIRDKYKDDPGL